VVFLDVAGRSPPRRRWLRDVDRRGSTQRPASIVPTCTTAGDLATGPHRAAGGRTTRR